MYKNVLEFRVLDFILYIIFGTLDMTYSKTSNIV
jgi:hypothetical protein